MKTVELRVQLPVGDAMASLASEIELRVAERVRELRAQQMATRHVDRALEQAISNVTRAITRVENAQHTHDEKAAFAALLSSAKGLRKAKTLLQKSKG